MICRFLNLRRTAGAIITPQHPTSCPSHHHLFLLNSEPNKLPALFFFKIIFPPLSFGPPSATATTYFSHLPPHPQRLLLRLMIRRRQWDLVTPLILRWSRVSFQRLQQWGNVGAWTFTWETEAGWGREIQRVVAFYSFQRRERIQGGRRGKKERNKAI